MPDPLARYAEQLATSLYGGGGMLAQATAAAARAQEAATALRRPRPEMLTAAACLHAVGTAPDFQRTGFVPVDGALGLLDMGWPGPVVSLVAHQMQARMIAKFVGARSQLSLVTRIQGWPADILDYALLTVADDGSPRSVDDGLAAVRSAQVADERIPEKVAVERLARLSRAGQRVHEALAER